MFSDRELGMDRAINRRDFLNGVVLTAAAAGLTVGTAGGPAHAASTAAADKPTAGPYPPAKSGLRGQTDEMFKVPHALRNGTFDMGQAKPTGERYDLVVVGAGLSGLAAAWFYHKKHANATILLLEVGEDFGGHAVRNEFEVDGRRLIGYGGSQSLDHPSTYSEQAKGLLKDVGIEVQRFESYFHKETYKGLGRATFFDKETFGRDYLAIGKDGLAEAPLHADALKDLAGLDSQDWLTGLSDEEKKLRLAELTYVDYLRDVVKVHPDVIKYVQTMPSGNWGYGADAVGALDAWGDGYPGFGGLQLDSSKPHRLSSPTAWKFWEAEDEYIYHFPDGNAGVARALVRALIPSSASGHTMEKLVTAKVRYDQLDVKGSKVRLRLSSPVVKVTGDGEVSYVQDGSLRSVHGAKVILACQHQMIPYLVPDLPEDQRLALKEAVRLPLLYTNVVLRDWKAFKNLGIQSVRYPGSYWVGASLDFPVSMGGYEHPRNPDEPITLHLTRACALPNPDPRIGAVKGRVELIQTPFEQIERTTRELLLRSLGQGGFDPARDITAITVNRWAHGYALEYGRPWATFYPDGPLPSATARRPYGNLAIANTDAGPRAYVDSAIDEAYQAVKDLD
ncbi:FAD/NAD(P)-binding protein [Microtetraspora sp. NBRC 16547]|uniref:NAD(P)-binding protein n=1 Tax=Microtetraspora sp. NBRC 16547 TaxID=3030993 RepID=UPI0024A529AC|nr:FAD/NAD(P)-binding protein [Microtetraspora sp. NBRC 16547]GLX00397.1 spermidine dehydrogenase SpdH [Microtetraspora sp. NBRC 16547]